MSAWILSEGTASFLGALALHILAWRWKKPPREMTWLLVIFILLPAAAWLAGIILGGVEPERAALAFIWHTALSLAYIMTYPPIQAGCPSLKIVLAVHRSGDEGLSREGISALFSEESMFDERFNNLVEDGLVSWQYDAWGITGAGRIIARFFLFYRRLLKLPLGEG